MLELKVKKAILETKENKDITLDVKEAFVRFDSGGTGSIPTDDVCRMIKNLGHVTSSTTTLLALLGANVTNSTTYISA